MATTAPAPTNATREVTELGRILRQLDVPEFWQAWLEPAIRLLLILIVGWALLRLLRLVIGRFEKRLLAAADHNVETQFDARKRIGTLVGLLRQVVNIVMFVILGLIVLMQLGVQVGPLIAGAGIVGVAVGFGAQYLVRDVITGFFIVLENQIRVGDVVTINGTGGLVEALTIRTVVLRDGNGVVHVFTHGNISTLSNATRDWSAYIFNFAIQLKEDPEEVMQAIRDAVAELRKDEVIGPKIIADVELWGVDKLDGGGFTIQGRIKSRPGQQADVARALLRKLRTLFGERSIEMSSSTPTIQLLPAPQLVKP